VVSGTEPRTRPRYDGGPRHKLRAVYSVVVRRRSISWSTTDEWRDQASLKPVTVSHANQNDAHSIHVVPEIRSVGRRRDGMASPRFFRQGRRVPHSSHFFGQKFVQKLVHCCNWLLTETQCKILFQYSGIFLTCMSVRVCRPKLFKNLCLSLVSGVPHYFLGLHPCPRYACGRTPIVTARLHHRFGSAPG